MASRGGGVGLLLVILFAALLLPVPIACSISNSLDGTKTSVRWEVGVYSACTAVCGGGVQTRSISCLRTSPWHQSEHPEEVSAVLCPLPSPAVTRPCNTHQCSARWKTGAWSDCSVTCGVGTQTREVTCESSLWYAQRFQVATSECGGSSPVTSRKCHVVDCPFGDAAGPHSIRAEEYTLIQLRRAKKLKLNIGGRVKLLPGQTVVVKCPVKHYSKKLVYWSKGYKLVSFMGRVRATFGGLQIRKADPKTDSGVYTCIAGDQRASITVQFIQRDDRSTRTYRTWIRNSKNKQFPYWGPKRKDKRSRNKNNIVVTSDIIGPQELRQQSDQSQNSSRALTLRFVAGDWSDCSATCGGERGHRKRKVSCSHVTHKYVKIVPDSACARSGLVKPETVRACSSGKACPVWRPGPWTKCQPSCGEIGYKNRYLVCEWEDTGLPAWSACDKTERPPVRKPCKTKRCPTECGDGSRYCSLAGLLKMCRFASFRNECCQTCHKQENSTL